MKVNEVPQDSDPTFEGGKKLCYALDEKGQFVPVKTSGWEIESTAKDLAWNAIRQDVENTRQLVLKGEASPLEYYMKLRQMDLSLLAENMGLSKFRVWWHLKPKQFAKLNEKWLQKYAHCLKIKIEDFNSIQSVQ